MKGNKKFLGCLMVSALWVMPAWAQGGQFIDCSAGNGQCDMLYSTDGSFITDGCPDCVQGKITIEPAVIKTSYRPLGESAPYQAKGKNRVNVTQIVQKETRNCPKDGCHEKVGGVWITHDTNEKLAYGEEVHDWEATRGETLKSLLTQWSEVSGWTLIWKLDRDYNLEAGVVFRGTYTEVASAIIRTFARAVPAPIGTFYKGNRVLVISVQEDENAH